jgi:hypothetical protein
METKKMNGTSNSEQNRQWWEKANKGHPISVSFYKWDTTLGCDIPRTPEEGFSVSVMAPSGIGGHYIHTTLHSFEELQRLSTELCQNFPQAMLEWFNWRGVVPSAPIKKQAKPTFKLSLDDLDL